MAPRDLANTSSDAPKGAPLTVAKVTRIYTTQPTIDNGRPSTCPKCKNDVLRSAEARQPENSKRAHLRVPALQKHHQIFTRRPPERERERKRAKKGRERGKKREILGGPAEAGPAEEGQGRGSRAGGPANEKSKKSKHLKNN